MNSATSSSWLGQLSELMDNQIQAGHALLENLQAEKQALTGSDVAALNQCGARKHAELMRFEQLERERQQLCRAGGIGPERSQMERLLTQMPPDHSQAMRVRWQTLADIIGRCRDANETNGLITQYKQRQILQLLGMLRGQSTVTYGPGGGAALPGNSRAIAQV